MPAVRIALALCPIVLWACLGPDPVSPSRGKTPQDSGEGTGALPAPAWAGITYDTARGEFLLRWHAVKAAGLAGYDLYARQDSARDTLLLRLAAGDTAARVHVYDADHPVLPPTVPDPRDYPVDTAYANDFDDLKPRSGALGKRSGHPDSVVFRVRARSRDSLEGPPSPDGGGPWVDPRILFSFGSITVSGTWNKLASPGDTLRLILDWRNQARSIRSIRWHASGAGEPIAEHPAAGKQGRDSVAYAWMSAGPQVAWATLYDDAGDTSVIAVTQYIWNDRPAAWAGRDTVLGGGDTLRLRGQARDRFSKSFRYAWDIGATGAFIPTATGDTLIRTPAREDSAFRCVLKVVDDDGNEALDTMQADLVRPGGANWEPLYGSGLPYPGLEPIAETQGAIPLVFQDRMWLIGGRTGLAGRGSVIVSSADGLHWEPPADSVDLPVLGDSGAAGAVFNDEMWVIGGFDGPTDGPVGTSVWHSRDGKSWTRAPDFPRARDGHACIVFAGKLWVLGGGQRYPLSGDSAMGDAWSTTDGAVWTRESDSAAFPPRRGHAALVFDGKLWVLCGRSGERSDYSRLRNDVWSSADGKTWNQVTAAAAFPPRSDCAAAAFGGSLYVTGGNGAPRGSAAVWESRDGAAWAQPASRYPIPLFQGQSVLEFRGHLWNLGGLEVDHLRIPYPKAAVYRAY
jgi:hypothetical protein